MKRLLAILLALMVLAVPALSEPMSLLDYTDDLTEDGCPIYYFQELSLKLPADWRGKVMAMPETGRTAFYQTASYEKYRDEGIEGGGFLFALGASVNGSFSQLPAFEYLGYSEESGMNYYLELPSDYPAYFEDAIRAEYDAMAAQIDGIAQGVSFYAEQAPAQNAESGVTLERMRYHFEHSAIPRYFYDDPANMLKVLREQSVYRLWTALADENGVDYPYTAEDFTEHWYDLDDGATILQVEMPAPEVSPQCLRIYMVHNPDAGTAGYFTVEYENLLGESAMLCGWSPEGEHVNYGGAAMFERGDAAALAVEANQIAGMAGTSAVQTSDKGSDERQSVPGLVEIRCPELGFSTMADPDYAWDYKDGTGITIYTRTEGSIPYVIVWQSEDLIMEPFEYIREQYTPHIQNQYGDDLVYFQEYESYPLGGKEIPAGVYTYRLQGKLVDLIRAYDSTGSRTVAYTAKYVQGEAEPTLSALHDAIRYFRAD